MPLKKETIAGEDFQQEVAIYSSWWGYFLLAPATFALILGSIAFFSFHAAIYMYIFAVKLVGIEDLPLKVGWDKSAMVGEPWSYVLAGGTMVLCIAISAMGLNLLRESWQRVMAARRLRKTRRSCYGQVG